MENNKTESRSVQDLLRKGSSLGSLRDEKIRRSRDFKFFGVTQSRTGTPDMSQSIKLILSTNEQLLIPYHQISTPIRYDGSGEIELSVDGQHFKISGIGLETIIDYIAEQRLMWIKEPMFSEDSFMDDEELVVIRSIEKVMIH